MVSRLKNLRDLVYSIIRKQGVGKGPGITNIGTNTLKLNQEAMDIIAEMQKAGYKIENIDEASIKIFLNNRNQPAPTGKQIIDSMEETDIYSQDNPFMGFKPEIVKDTKKVDPVKATSAKDLMSELAKMTSKNVDDIKLGIASKTKKTKDPVDPALQELEDRAKPFKEFEARDKTRSGKINYEVMEDFLGTKLRGNESFDELLEIERKAKAKKPPEDKADGGRIGFGDGSSGSGLPAIQLESQPKGDLPPVMPENFGFQPLMPVMNEKMITEGSSLKELMKAIGQRTTPNYGIGYKMPFMGGTLGFGGGPFIGDTSNQGIGFGFRKSFKDGSKMSRRTFLKLMGGLASIPFLGKYFKGAKTAAKVTEAATSTSGVPTYFPKLVQKIKEFGTDVTQKSATVERQRVIEYKNYELTEDLTNGDMTVVKTDEGMGTFQTADGDFDSFDGISSQEVMDFKKGYQDIDTTTGKTIEVPSKYEEVTIRPDMDGKMKDVEDGLDNVDEIMREVDMIKTDYKMSPGGKLRNKKKKLASGGVAYMLGE